MSNDEYQNGSALFNVRNRSSRKFKETHLPSDFFNNNTVNAEHSDVISGSPYSVIIKEDSYFGAKSGKSIEHPSTLFSTTEIINMSNTDINISNRFGYVYRLKPGTENSSLRRLTLKDKEMVLRYGSGLYIIVRHLSNLESIVPTVGLLNSIENSYKESGNNDDALFGITENRRLFGKVLENKKELEDKISDVIKATKGPYSTNLYLANSELVTVFYYPEDIIRMNKIIYDKELDIVISPNVVNYKQIIHPSFSIEESELHQVIQKELTKQGRLESIKFITNKENGKIYRRVGNKIQTIGGEKPTNGEESGLYIYTSYLNEEDCIEVVKVFIPYHDKETLQEHGYFCTSDEARTYNSEIEIRKLKQQEVILNNQFKEREREHELKVRQLNEEINQKERELKELKLKLDHIETLSSHENSREERTFKREEREYLTEKQQDDRKYRLIDRNLDLEEKVIEERSKRVKAEIAAASAGSSDTSRNLASTAGIITGAAAIAGAVTKVITDSKKTTTTGVIAKKGFLALSASGAASSAVAGIASKSAMGFAGISFIGAALPVIGAAAAVVGIGYLLFKGIEKLFDF
jgi:hypothetical protein|nr:MAG TPA: hypothetical protein [Caudoviricetes sp.]